ncbi:MAG: hypothetical protein ACJ8ER_05795 [Allosphingosinicella sp.]
MIFQNRLSERSLRSLRASLEGEAGLTRLLGGRLGRADVVALACVPEPDVDIADIDAARPGYEVSLRSALALVRGSVPTPGDLVIHDLWARPDDVRPEARLIAQVTPASHGVYYRVARTEDAEEVVRRLVSFKYSLFSLDPRAAPIIESESFVEGLQAALISAFDGASYFLWKAPRAV